MQRNILTFSMTVIVCCDKGCRKMNLLALDFFGRPKILFQPTPKKLPHSTRPKTSIIPKEPPSRPETPKFCAVSASPQTIQIDDDVKGPDVFLTIYSLLRRHKATQESKYYKSERLRLHFNTTKFAFAVLAFRRNPRLTALLQHGSIG